jgi:hypothetical protein
VVRAVLVEQLVHALERQVVVPAHREPLESRWRGIAGEPWVGEPLVGEPLVGEPLVGEPLVGEPLERGGRSYYLLPDLLHHVRELLQAHLPLE